MSAIDYLLDDTVRSRDNPLFVYESAAAPVANFAGLWVIQSHWHLPWPLSTISDSIINSFRSVCGQ